MKPREHGSLHEALGRAIDQVGGAKAAADLIDRGSDWLYSAADPNRERGKAATLNHPELRTLCRHGATALAEDFALLCGGLFLPPVPKTAPGAIQAALAVYVTESADVISETIRRAADGEIDRTDAVPMLKEIDDAIRAMMGLRALVVEVIESGEALR